MNLEKAIRNKFRFPSVQGDLDVEQLFDLPLQSSNARRADLDSVAKEINRQLRAEVEDSFVETSTNTKKTELTEKLEIVVYIISVKKAENQARLDAAAKRQQKERLLEILGNKKDQELQGKTPEELQAMIDAL